VHFSGFTAAADRQSTLAKIPVGIRMGQKSIISELDTQNALFNSWMDIL